MSDDQFHVHGPHDHEIVGNLANITQGRRRTRTFHDRRVRPTRRPGAVIEERLQRSAIDRHAEVFAQPLFVDGGGTANDLVFVVTKARDGLGSSESAYLFGSVAVRRSVHHSDA